MRWCAVIVLGGSLLLNTGCLNSVLGTLIAPEGVAASGASELVGSAAQSLSGASLQELSSLSDTVGELDRIIQENPDAVNNDLLRGLRDQLKKGEEASTGPDQRQVMKDPPRPRRLSDTPLPVRKGDNLRVLPPGENVAARRPTGRPDTLPDGSSLRPDPRPVHTMGITPVRLTSSGR